MNVIGHLRELYYIRQHYKGSLYNLRVQFMGVKFEK